MSPWTFRTYGLIEQYQIESEADLSRIDALDEARWTATSAPLEQLNIDPIFLSFVDRDGDGRVRVRELQEARRWLWGMLRTRTGITEGSDVLVLDHLDPESTDAVAVRRLAAHLLERLEAPAQDRISLAQVRQFQQVYVSRYPNGDGVVTAEQVPEALRPALAEALHATGGATDLSGAPGVRSIDVDAWLERVGAWLAWHDRGQQEAALLHPLGADTPAAAALIAGLAPKVAQFFAQCDLLRLESHAATRLRATPEALAALDTDDPAAIRAWLQRAALASPTAESRLPLSGAVNGNYATDLERLGTGIAPRILGLEAPLEALTPQTWERLHATVRPWLEWQAAEPADLDRTGGPEHLRAWLDDPAPAALKGFAVGDTDIADELVQFRSLERVTCLQQSLLLLANNFISFPDLFSGDRRALFEMGTLIIDGNRVNLCVRVLDIAAHKKIAAESLMFLAYVSLARREAGVSQTGTVAAAVTAGSRGGIGVGKRGVFYDREGREWDAVVVDVVAHPISLWEATVAPFLRLRDSIVSRLESLVSSKTAESESALVRQTDASAATLSTAGKTPPAAAPAATPTPAPAKKPSSSSSSDSGSGSSNTTNLLMGGTIAFAAAGSALTLLVRTIASIPLTNLLAAMLGVIGVTMGLSALLGWLRLRRRDLATLLEACGFALNGRMFLSTHLARTFTKRPGLPAGAVRRLVAPRSRVGWVVLLLVLLVVGLSVAALLNPAVLDALSTFSPTPAELPPTEAP